MRIAGAQASLITIPLAFKLMFNTESKGILLERTNGGRIPMHILSLENRIVPEWFNLEAHYSSRVHIRILVILD